MSGVLTPALQRKSGYKLRKIRELSLKGQILVKEGDSVKADQIVAKAEFPGELMILKVAENLGIDHSEVLKYLTIKEGDEVNTGDVICEYKGLFGLFKNTYKSNHSGKVEFINKETGHVGLRQPSRIISLNAYIPGTVISSDGKKSITIETNCTFIQGIFGVGGEQFGTLKALNVKPNAIITASDIPSDIKGKILYGGASPESQALKKAAELGASGFVTGSIDDKALADFLGYDIGIALTGNENIPLSLIITEGFGSLPMSETVLNLLKSSEGMEASINGATQVRAGALRPEIIISGSSLGSDQPPDGTLKVGAKIRIIREPYFGKVATVLDLPFKPEKVDSGAEVRVLRAQTEDQQTVTVPRANVEIL